MKAIYKKTALFALISILLGALIFFIGFAISGFNIFNLTKIEHVEKTYSTEAAPVSRISVTSGSYDVTLRFEDGIDKISATYGEKLLPDGEVMSCLSASVEGGVLNISVIDSKKFTIWDFNSSKLNITIPSDVNADVAVNVKSADINVIGNAILKSLDIEVSSGDVDTTAALISVNGAISVDGDTGDVELGEITAASLEIETDTGDVKLNKITTGVLNIECDTGDVELGKITAESIRIETDTGDVECDGGVIEASSITVTTDTGDVELTLSGSELDYTVKAYTATGSSNVSDRIGGEKTLTVRLSTGDIRIKFEG